MMFTEKAMKAAEEKFSRLLEKAGEKKRERNPLQTGTGRKDGKR